MTYDYVKENTKKESLDMYFIRQSLVKPYEPTEEALDGISCSPRTTESTNEINVYKTADKD